MGHSLLRFSPFHIVIITVLVFLGVMGLRSGGYLEHTELGAFDWSLRLRPTQALLNPPISLVVITDNDIRQLGHWPVSDEILTKALSILTQQHPRVIGVDIYRDMEVPPGRSELDRILRNHPEITMVMKFDHRERGKIAGPAVLQGTDRVGFSDMLVDSDGIVRRGLIFLDDGTNFYRSFSWLLAGRYLEQEGMVPQSSGENSDWVQLGQTVFRPLESHDGSYVSADPGGYQFLLNLERGENVFPAISFSSLLAGDFNSELFRNRIVLLGVNSQGVKDYFYTSECGALTVCPPIAGVELHGYVVLQLLRAAQEKGFSPITTYSDAAEAGWIALWVLGGALIGIRARGAWRFSLAMLSGILLLGGTVMGGMMLWQWIPFIPPLLGWMANAVIVGAWVSNREKQDREMLMSLFSRHVSPQVAEAVWAQRDQFLENGRLRPQKLVVTTLFSDLEAYSPIAENMEAQRLLNWLNTYLESMVKIIADHGGIVDDYYGDMIKADFGVFKIGQTEEDINRDAKNAMECAISMHQEMIRLNAKWQAQGLPVVRMRIGMNTGPVVAGSLGSAQRLKFTTIGDSVNIASRLESFQKDSEETWARNEVCRILLGEATKRFLGDNAWPLKEIGAVTLKGKTIKIPVYRLIVNSDLQEGHSPKTSMQHAME